MCCSDACACEAAELFSVWLAVWIAVVHVLAVGPRMWEALKTLGTLERLLPAVQTFVFSKVVLMLERLGAHIALVWPLACYIMEPFLKSTVFFDVMYCSMVEVYQYFRIMLLNSYQTTWHHTPHNNTLHSQLHDNPTEYYFLLNIQSQISCASMFTQISQLTQLSWCYPRTNLLVFPSSGKNLALMSHLKNKN